MTDVHVLIPAHNEADTIGRTIASLRAQTLPPVRILVVADNCTDTTVEIARAHGAQVMCSANNADMKAGAMNQGLELLLAELCSSSKVLIMDADSRLVPEFIETALSRLEESPGTGAVCATFNGEEDRKGFIHVLQRAEYARFARSQIRRGEEAHVLSGVATIFPVPVLREILSGRMEGRLPAAPGVYDVTAATEDIEMTYAVRSLGYRPVAPRECIAYTDTMGDWTALVHQRLRWQRGMLDALRLYGINRLTLPYLLRLGWMYVGSMIVPLYFTMLTVMIVAGQAVFVVSWWLLVVPFFMFERWWTTKGCGWRERLLAVLLLPEWLYDNYRACVYWLALFRWLKRTERVWIPT